MAILKRIGGYRTTYKCDWKPNYYKACYANIRSQELPDTSTITFMYAIPYKCQGSHVTFLSKEEIIEYVTEIIKLVGGKILTFNDDGKFYWFQVLLLNDDRFLLYVSTVIRYCFEDYFSIMTYCAFHNYELRKHMNIINLVQLYISRFELCDNHSLLVSGYTMPGISPKCWFNNYRNYFTTNKKDAIHIKCDRRDVYWSSNVETKCLPEIALHFNNKINEIYERHKESLRCW